MTTEWVRLDPDAREYIPLPMPHASKMIGELENTPPNRDHIPSWDEEIGVYDGEGQKLFAYHADGTVDVIDPERVPEAAVIFFRTVIEIAELQGYKVRKIPESNDQGIPM